MEPPGQGTTTTDGADHWDVKRLRTWTADRFRKQGFESPALDADVLLAHVLGWSRIELYTRQEEEVGARGRSDFKDVVRRRLEGAPVAYLIGRKEFFSLTLAVSPAVLIPRPDSETLVVETLAALKGLVAPRVLDIGTGSGNLALAIAKHHLDAKVMATDTSAEALAVAETNARSLGLSDRLTFRRGDLYEAASDEAPFDAILSNPPYIATATLATLDRGVRDFEPHTALDGGVDGFRVVDRLIEGAVPRLKPGGHLLLEIGSDQDDAVRQLVTGQPGLLLLPTVRDHANHPRVIHAIRP